MTTKIKRGSRQLSCVLTDLEILERGQSLAQACKDVRAEEERQTTEKKRLKEALETLEEERERLSKIVSDGREDRQVAIEVAYDYQRARVTTTRLDTGEEVESRAMTEDERQLLLPEHDGARH